MLKLYNTLTRKKEVFKPLKDKQVRIYTCGPTVHDFVHIGNLRAYVFADILRRVLKLNGYKVKQVMNITDVDDKTIKKSQEIGESLKGFASRYEKAFFENIKDMNIEKPEIMPHATDNIQEMVSIIKDLLKKGIAYKTDDGIYFSIKKFKNYGKLSGIKIKKLKAGASKRVLKDEYEKSNVNDFALWKFYDKKDGNVFWETEIGKGRPGWHIECSAMATKYLGKQFDIHMGGVDLIFPHHENEIAQSEASFGKKPWVKYWVHNEWLLVDGEKMSKSKGNFYKLKDITSKGYFPLDLRYFFLSAHYRKPLNFTFKNLGYAKNSLQRLKEIISKLSKKQKKNKKNIELAHRQFFEFLNDDLNFPKALSYMWDVLRDDRLNDSEKYELVLRFDRVFGLDLDKKEKIEVPEKVKKLVKEREMLRKKKEWKKADEIRKKINKSGFIIEDVEGGVIIKKRKGWK